MTPDGAPMTPDGAPMTPDGAPMMPDGASVSGEFGRARRELAVAVVGCAAAAGLALLAASQGWAAPDPGLGSPRRDPGGRGGAGDWISALAFVALGGAGALVAVRGFARRILGGLLAACGTGIGVIAAAGLFADRPPGWAVAAVTAGAVVAMTGGFAVWRAGAWPAMGSRFERAGTGVPEKGVTTTVDGTGGSAGTTTAAETALWDAIDRGEDPTR